MAKTLVENRICNSCGADVRPDTQFCYSCGESVMPASAAQSEIAKNVAGKNGDESALTGKSATGNIADKPIPKPILTEEAKLKSAAAMRRKSKSFQAKKTEIVWEEYENAPNGWFILAAVVLSLAAIGILYLALYLK